VAFQVFICLGTEYEVGMSYHSLYRQEGGHAPIHPQAPKMIFIEQNKRIFVEGKEDLYRRLSIRECARIQTFPDDHIFYYSNLMAGYKMVGNAVPCNLAYCLGKSFKKQLIAHKAHNRVAKGISPSAPTTPCIRLRTGRFINRDDT